MIQQSISAAITVIGDGTSTAFNFDLGRVYALNFFADPALNSSGVIIPIVLNHDAIPDDVHADVVIPTSSGITVTASISRRTITFTFSSAFTGNLEIVFELLFNG